MSRRKDNSSTNSQTAMAPVSTVAPWRFVLVVVVLTGLALLAIYQIASHQVLAGDKGHDFLRAQGDARTVRVEPIAAHRGMITDRYGEPLAVSTPVVTLWANPKILQAETEALPRLASLLGMPADELREKLARYHPREFMYLARHLSPGDATVILEQNIDGVYSLNEFKRFYPAGEVASHVLGFTNIDDVGQEGIELAYNDWLMGKAGKKRVVKDLKGRVIQELRVLEAEQHGGDLALSIDLRLQYVAYKALKEAVENASARAGSAVVLDVDTGEVLAIVNQPSYNPNNRSLLKADSLRNRVMTDTFEPGSTVKPITMLAALESEKFTPQTVVDTAPGYIKVGKKTLLDPVNYGAIDVQKIITKSSQVGTTKVALELDPYAVRSVFSRVGLGEISGSGFPGEAVGILPSPSRWRDIERATFAFGHGLSITTMQLAQAYSVLANQGVKKQVSLIRQDKAPFSESVVDASLAREILDMMETVTQPGGTGVRAQIPAYRVAGKTGTAHKVGAQGYSDNRYLALFAGVAPVSNPKLVTVVVIDEPQGDRYYGGEVAAPVFSTIVSSALQLLGVEPDGLEFEIGGLPHAEGEREIETSFPRAVGAYLGPLT